MSDLLTAFFIGVVGWALLSKADECRTWPAQIAWSLLGLCAFIIAVLSPVADQL